MTELQQFPTLEAFGQELERLADRDARRRERFSRFGRAGAFAAPARLALAATVVAVLLGGAYAVPPTRAAVDDVVDAMSGWVSGDEGAAPGRPVASGEAVPSWVAAEDGEKRVLAETSGQKLVAIRQGDEITFALAGYGATATIDAWRRQLAGTRLSLVGAGRFVDDGRHDRRPVFGLVAGSIRRVQLNYADGRSPTVQDGVHDAFALTIATDRRPDSLVGYDADGRPVTRVDVSRREFRYCPDARGCPAWSDAP
jgi:hypothetical protein